MLFFFRCSLLLIFQFIYSYPARTSLSFLLSFSSTLQTDSPIYIDGKRTDWDRRDGLLDPSKWNNIQAQITHDAAYVYLIVTKTRASM